MTQFSFVTVSHAADEWLLRIQARSLRLYLSPLLVGEIVVVENFDAGKATDWRDRLLPEYGHLAPLVRFIRAPFFGPMPAAAGWWTQQALKLLVARNLHFRRYVALDAKNHLVRPLHRDFLETPDGRIRTRRYGYASHPLRNALERTLAFCDVRPDSLVNDFTPTSTPFTIETPDALEVIAFVEEKDGRPFAEAFIDRQLTEFFLLAGRLEHRNLLSTRYEFSQIACPVVWDHLVEPMPLLGVVREADERGAPVFAVHRRGAAKMGPLSREILGQFWKRRGLFGSTSDAVRELERAAAL